ncbi:glycosyltransferase family 4 protein [Bacillus carboniphilus]|uniref:Glycosyltransferase family 4 protein n=1 Tax=Bacillus carboniphilus TaxID=86663 RepID=A0ABY9JV00_9BACI|nr:glycosyltransferase family 4 protein [Bacillus carboniphilus]WLR41506.1 glycosyltransferase family 4 protein [Bacillus carboniphilus]
MKILYISWFSSNEGSRIHANEFMNAMEKIGHEVIPVDLSNRKNYKNNNMYHKKNAIFIQPFFTEISKLFGVIPRFLRLRNYVKKINPDVVINRYSIYDISAIIIRLIYRIPYVAEVNASSIVEKDITKQFYFKRTARLIEKYIFRKADIVTVVSKELLKYFEENEYRTDNVIVIPNGVDAEKFNSERTEQLEGYPFDEWEGKEIIGFLGSLKSWHGVERLIDILPVLIEDNPLIRLLIIGDGEEHRRLSQLVMDKKLSNYVHITGNLPYDHIPKALKSVNVCIAPYYNIDHFYFSPIKIFEYMAMGKPVIAPALGQCEELIVNNHNGILLPENTNEQLIVAIKRIFMDKKQLERLGVNAREFIINSYTWEQNAKQIDGAIRNVLVK